MSQIGGGVVRNWCGVPFYMTVIVREAKPPGCVAAPETRMYYGFYPSSRQQPQQHQRQLYFPPPPAGYRSYRPRYARSPLAHSQSYTAANESSSVKDLISRWTGISFLKRKLDHWCRPEPPMPKQVRIISPNPKHVQASQDQTDRVRLRTADEHQTVPRRRQHTSPPMTPISTSSSMDSTKTDASGVKGIAEKIEGQRQAAFVQYLLDLSATAELERQYFPQADAKHPGKYIVRSGQRYDFHQTIGAGSFSKVKLAEDLQEKGKWVAIKLVETAKLRLNGRLQKTLARELGILSRVKHQSIVKFEGLFVVRGYICLTMEFVKGGELFKAISDLGGAGIKETEARDILKQLLGAVLHLHSIGVVHRDLKLENILVCEDNETADDAAVQIKLVDFGLGRSFREGQLLETRCGSEEYAAPEIIRGQPYDGRLADAWSFGVIMYACLSGHLPFNPDGKGSLASKIVAGRFSIDETAISQAAVQIIRGLLTVDPAKRTTLQSLQHHHYFL